MDEQKLIQLAQSGDRMALEMLLRTMERPIYKTAYYMLDSEQDARDVTQEVLLRICRKIDDYEHRVSFKAWVMRITTNRCTDWLRQRKPNQSMEELSIELHASASTEGEAVSNLFREELRQALEELPRPVRSVVLLRFVNEWTYQEISQSTNLPLNTVKSHIHRARTWLQQRMTRENRQKEVRS